MSVYFNNLRPFQRCVERLQDDFESLESYFHVPSEKVDGNILKSIQFSMEPTETLGVIHCTFTYKEISILEKQGGKFLQIPEDCERHIYSFLKTSKRLVFQIDCTNIFPIRPPKITILESNSKTLSESLIAIACKIHSDEWSPALGLDCTLLIVLNVLLDSVNYV